MLGERFLVFNSDKGGRGAMLGTSRYSWIQEKNCDKWFWRHIKYVRCNSFQTLQWSLFCLANKGFLNWKCGSTKIACQLKININPLKESCKTPRNFQEDFIEVPPHWGCRKIVPFPLRWIKIFIFKTEKEKCSFYGGGKWSGLPGSEKFYICRDRERERDDSKKASDHFHLWVAWYFPSETFSRLFSFSRFFSLVYWTEYKPWPFGEIFFSDIIESLFSTGILSAKT